MSVKQNSDEYMSAKERYDEKYIMDITPGAGYGFKYKSILDLMLEGKRRMDLDEYVEFFKLQDEEYNTICEELGYELVKE